MRNEPESSRAVELCRYENRDSRLRHACCEFARDGPLAYPTQLKVEFG